MFAPGTSPLSGPSSKCITNNVAPVISSPTCLFHGVGILRTPLTHYRPLFRNMPRRSSLKAMSMLLLPDTVAVSHISDMTLPIVIETRPIDVSATFAISVPVTLTDFAQTEDCIVVFIQLRTINTVPQRILYVFCYFNTVSLPLIYCCIEAFPKHCHSFPQGSGPP